MRWKLLVVLLVTAVSLAWALWGLDVGAVSASMAGYHPSAVVLVTLVFTATFAARCLRFWLLLDAPLPFRPVVPVMAVGFLAINVVPLRMGELVRPYLLLEQHQVPFGTSMAAVVMERLFDLLALLVMMGLVAWTVDLPEGGIVLGGVDLLSAGQRVTGTSVAVGLVGFLALALAGQRGVDLVAGATRAVVPAAAPIVERLGGRFAAAFAALAQRPGRAAVCLGLTAFVWGGTVFAVAMAMTGFDALVPTAELAVVNWTATMTAMLLVPTPGFVGSFHLGSVGSLVLLGVDPDVARAFSMVFYVEQFGFTAVSGLLFLLAQGWSLTRLVQASRAAS